MRKGKNVIGQTVISYADGRKIETVKDVLLSASDESIAALLVDEGGLLSGSRVVPIEAVQAFGRDAIVIRDAGAMMSASDDPDTKAILNRNDKLLGKRVLTTTGDALGAVSDMYFEEGTGRVLGLELSSGVLGDLAKGNSYLPVEEIDRMGPDVIFVRPETGAQVQGQVGGLVGVMGKAGDSIDERVNAARADIQARIAKGPPEDALVGRRSGADLADENGNIIVANGQRIRPEHVEAARASGNMDALVRAAAAGSAREAGDRAGETAADAADSLGAVWDRFTRRIGEARDDQGRQADAQQTQLRLSQIADAIGRPVGKVILDRDDNVILDFGDIITHQAVQQAYDAGMLDTLLANVYRAEFGLPLEQLKAQQPASARIEQASGGATVVEELEQKVQRTEQERAQREAAKRAEADAAAATRERARTERAQTRRETQQQREREVEAARQGTAVTR